MVALAKPLWHCHGILPTRPTPLELELDLLMWWGGTVWEYSDSKITAPMQMLLDTVNVSPCFPLYCPLASHVCVASASVRLSEQWPLWFRINAQTSDFCLGPIIVKYACINPITLIVSTLVGSDPSRQDGKFSVHSPPGYVDLKKSCHRR